MRVTERADSIRVSRPVLRFLAGVMMLLIGVGTTLSALSDGGPDRIPPGDAAYFVLLFVVLSAVYAYVDSTLEVTATSVVISNPCRRIAIPVGHVTSVRAGSNLRVETEYGHAYAWGVEAANADLVLGRVHKQESLADVVLTRADEHRADAITVPPARYRWVLPPTLVLVAAPVYLVGTVAIATGWSPLFLRH